MASSIAADQLTPLKRFWKLLTPDRKDIGYIYLYSILIGLISLAGPLGVQAIINLIAGGDFNASLVVLAVVVTAAAAFMSVLKIMQIIVAETLQRKLFARAALEFAYRLPRIRLEALRDSYPPELVNRFFDVVNVQKGLPKILLDFSGAVMQMLFGILLITFYNAFFGFIGLLLIASISVMLYFLSRPSLNASLYESKYKYAVAGWLEDIARANNTFKLAGGARLSMRRTDELVGGYLDYRGKHFKLLLWHYGLLTVLQAFTTVAFLLLGGYLVIENQINIGQFVAAELVILIIVSNSEKVVYTFETVYDTLTGIEKMASVTDLPLEIGGRMNFANLDSGEGIRLDVNKLSFTYPRSGDLALHEIDLSIASNERLCIAGFNRSGRSTLTQLLSGLRLDFTGRLLYNDTPLGNYDLDSLRQAIGDYTPQEEVIHANVIDNICLGHPNVAFTDIQWAIKLAGLEDWLAEQTHGYETVMVAEGLDLPRSVRTRLLIARAVVRRPRLLIIGGLLEQLQPALRHAIVTNLMDRQYKWTLVIASNDPQIAALSDNVAILHNARMVAYGRPDEVLKRQEYLGVWTGSLGPLQS